MNAELDRVLAAEPHEPTVRHLRDVVGTPIALWIGNEGGHSVIAGLHIARTWSGCQARLVCAVVPADEVVAGALRWQARELALPTAHVLVPDAAVLAACLHVAAVVVGAPEVAHAMGRQSVQGRGRPSEISTALVAAFTRR